jgi:two-component system OmpR family response regulator/two-component system copper resistance phosphate regulon response regulator CusR
MITQMNSNDFSGPILVIEDDPILNNALVQALLDQGYQCEAASDGKTGIAMVQESSFPIIILDLALADETGLGVLRCLREADESASIIVLTPLEFRKERLSALASGAEDFIIKPFALAEVRARVDAAWVKTQARPKSTLEVGPLNMDLASRKVQRDGRLLQLTPTEFRVLEILMRNQGKVVTRRMLCEHLWDPKWEGVTNVIEVHINRLRTKINNGTEPQMIYTIRGSGYSLRYDPLAPPPAAVANMNQNKSAE